MKINIGLVVLMLTVLALVVLAAAQPPALATGTPTIQRWVFGGGGSTVTQSIYALTGVTGQVVAGKASNGSSWLCTGILCGLPVYHISVPLVFRYP